MHRKRSTASLHYDRVDDALRKIEANLESAEIADKDPHLFEAVDRVLSSHACHDVVHVYELLLKGLTWAEVSARVDAHHVSHR